MVEATKGNARRAQRPAGAGEVTSVAPPGTMRFSRTWTHWMMPEEVRMVRVSHAVPGILPTDARVPPFPLRAQVAPSESGPREGRCDRSASPPETMRGGRTAEAVRSMSPAYRASNGRSSAMRASS